MAGDWLKIRVVLPECPQVHAIAAKLKKEPEAICGYLIRVWAWAQEFTADGTVRFVPGSALDRKACLPGLAEAMVSVGWLELPDAGGIIFPAWDEHNSRGAKERAMAGSRKRKEREAVTEMSRSDRDKSVTTEEKRREQKSRGTEESGIPPSGRYSGAERPRKRVRRTQAPIRIDGSETPLTPQAEVIEHWEKVWLLSRGSPWSHSPRDFILAAQALKLANGDLEAVKARVSMLLSQGEDAWVAQNASLELLVKRWNQLAVRVLPLAPEIRDVRSKQADIDAAFARIHARNGNGDAGTPRLPPALGGPPAVAGD